MSIVIITIPDTQKQKFVSDIQEQTNGGIKLVVIQKPKRVSFKNRWRTYSEETLPKTIANIWYTLLLRCAPRARHALTYFRAPSEPTSGPWAAQTIETDDINSPEILTKIKAVGPSLLVTWGSTIVQQKVLDQAPTAINLHLGLAPHYRGAVANQFAVAEGALDKVGYTIHHLTQKADAGDIIQAQAATIADTPRETFNNLNRHAYQNFVAIVTALYKKQPVPHSSQDISIGKNIRLQEWTPRRRYHLAKRMLHWQKSKQPPRQPIEHYE